MKKVNALILGLAVLLAFGCGTDDEVVTPANTNPTLGNFSKCQLIKDREDTLTSKYTYDAKGRIQEKTNAYGRERFEYNSAGNIFKWVRLRSNLDTANINIYEYSNSNLPVKITTWAKMTSAGAMSVWGTQSITYDSLKRLASKTNYNGNQPAAIISKINYTYPANNRITIEAWELNTGTNTLQLHYEGQMTYDNNKTPWGDGSPYNFFVNHNELSYAVQFHQPFSYSHSRTSTYTFNAAGYPTERIEVTDGNYTTRSTYTYNCQ